MPIREFGCSQCAEEFEELILRASDEEEVVCPRCGSKKVQRLMSCSSIGRGTSHGTAPRARDCGPFR